MKKTVIFSIISFFINFICVLFIVLSPIFFRILYSYILIFVLIFVLIIEYIEYKKLNTEQKFRFSEIYFLLSVFFAISLVLIRYFYIKINVPVDAQSYNYFQLTLLPYAYCYPVFIFPSLFAMLKYSDKSLAVKRILGVTVFLALTVIPLIFQINLK